MSGHDYVCTNTECDYLGVGRYVLVPGKCPVCGDKLMHAGWDEEFDS